MAPPTSDSAPTPRDGALRLGRLGLIVWLLAPLLIVLGLWLMIDRTQGRPDPRFLPQTQTPAATEPGPAPAETPHPAPATR